MKQVLFRGGKVIVEEVPAPRPKLGQVLVRVKWSCVSPGTELATAAATSTASMLDRVRQNPALLQRAFGVLRDRGLGSLQALAQERLSFSTLSGYSCAGVVVAVGPGVEDLASGDRVACAGSGYANHAEVVTVPRNLIARIPDGVSCVDSATVALGAIAMQGARRAQVGLGELVGVIGLGFVGQLTVQLLKAAGCKVFGMDLDPSRVAQAKALGLDAAPDGSDAVDVARRFSKGYGLDAVILAAATKSDEPLHLAMQITRRKGRVVVVGDVGLDARREAMYAKELDLLISTSYGPGRYDPTYEEQGLDYPYAYARWTENRNMQAYLDLIGAGQVTLGPLTTRRLPVSEAAEAYRILQEEQPRPYTVLLEYPADNGICMTRQITARASGPVQANSIRLAILGAGSFARSVHLPNLRRLGDRFRIEAIVTQHGPTALDIARQVGARVAGTDCREILADSGLDAVLIATPHNLHAEMVEEALRAGKHIFVEKPLALTEEELHRLEKLVNELYMSPSGCPVVFVGFNRRYSPYAARLHQLVAERSTPLHLIYRMNAGYIPPEHWVQSSEGGGRLVGEACHIFDLFRFLVGEPAVEANVIGVRAARRDVMPTDNFTATLHYAEGSVCTLLYTAQGGRDLPKEALELHWDGRSCRLDDYRSLQGFGVNVSLRTRRQEKGHPEELLAFQQAIAGSLDRRAIWDEAAEVTRTALELDRQVRNR
jgi:predicted dehydrogenase/threonine dehydrogenase-like Zn-dependent dehydrogenase